MNKLLWLIIISNIFLLLILNFFPYPELFIYPYLTQQGLLPYKDIFDQHFPGIMFLPINLNNLGFTSPLSMRIIQIGLVIINQLLIYKISCKLITKKQYLLLPNILYLIWQPFFEGWVLWIDSFMPMFLLSSYYLILQSELKQLKKIFFAGFIIGSALAFKQVVAPIILIISLYLLFKTKNIKLFLTFGIGSAVPAILLLVYIFAIEVWPEFYYWTVTFNITTFAEFGRKFATNGELIKMFPVYGLAILSSIYLIYRKSDWKVILLILFFVSTLVFAYARFDFVHLQPSLPFALLLLAISFMYLKKYKVSIGLLYLIVSLLLVSRFYIHNMGDKTYFWTEYEENLVNVVNKRVSPGSKIFAMGTTPHIYSLTNTLPSGNVFVFQFPWFMMKAEDKILQGLQNDPPKLVLRDPGAIADNMNLVSYMKKIDEYLKNNYQMVENQNGVEIWTKNK